MEGCMPRGYIATAPSSNPAAQVIAVTSLSWVCCSLEYRGSLSVLKQVDEDGSRTASPPSRCSRNRCCASLHPCSWENPAAGARLDPVQNCRLGTCFGRRTGARSKQLQGRNCAHASVGAQGQGQLSGLVPGPG